MSARSGRLGVATTALVVILVITTAWWMLALWPAGTASPEWIVRTRAACFGTEHSGWPDAGGWILLIGEPIGMLVTLVAIAGAQLEQELGGTWRWLRAMPLLRTAVPAVAVLVAFTLGLGIVLRTTAHASQLGAASASDTVVVQTPAPRTTLVDQHGSSVSLSTLHRTAIITVAFGHCEVVCPTIVRQVQRARATAGREAMPLFIVTVDPWRDTAERLPTIAHEWNLGPSDHVLSGGLEMVERTLDSLHIGRARDPNTGNVTHANVVMLVDGSGKVAWRLDGDFTQLAARLAAER